MWLSLDRYLVAKVGQLLKMSTYIVPSLHCLFLNFITSSTVAMRVRSYMGFRASQTSFTVSAVPSALMRLKMASGRFVSMRILTVPSGSSNALLVSIPLPPPR